MPAPPPAAPPRTHHHHCPGARHRLSNAPRSLSGPPDAPSACTVMSYAYGQLRGPYSGSELSLPAGAPGLGAAPPDPRIPRSAAPPLPPPPFYTHPSASHSYAGYREEGYGTGYAFDDGPYDHFPASDEKAIPVDKYASPRMEANYPPPPRSVHYG